MFKKSFNEKGDKEMNFLADSQNLVLDSMNYSRFAEKIVYNMQIAMEYENYYYFAENNFQKIAEMEAFTDNRELFKKNKKEFM